MSALLEEQRPRSGGELTEIFLKCRRKLHRLVAGIVRPADIEDIVQEAFIRAYQVDIKHEIKHPRTYLYKAALHLALNHRDRKFQSNEEGVSDLDALAVSQDDLLESQAELDEKFRLFCTALRQLPPQCRRVFILKRIYGMTQKEIGAELGISERTVEVHLAKGLLRCDDYLRAHGYSFNFTSRRSTAGRRAAAKT